MKLIRSMIQAFLLTLVLALMYGGIWLLIKHPVQWFVLAFAFITWLLYDGDLEVTWGDDK